MMCNFSHDLYAFLWSYRLGNRQKGQALLDFQAAAVEMRSYNTPLAPLITQKALETSRSGTR